MKLFMNRATLQFAGSVAACNGQPYAILEVPTDKHGLINFLNELHLLIMKNVSAENKELILLDDIRMIINETDLPGVAKLASAVFDRMRELTRTEDT